MIDTAKEWLESLYASNAPEADWAKGILDRLDGAERLEDAEAADRRAAAAECRLAEVCDAIGTGDPDEAIEMAHAMRAALNGE